MPEIKHLKSRMDYISNIKPGNVISFNVPGDKMISGKVVEICEPEQTPDGKERKYIVRTNNCSIFYVVEKDITWVKTGTRWPLGIYNALKLNGSFSKTVEKE